MGVWDRLSLSPVAELPTIDSFPPLASSIIDLLVSAPDHKMSDDDIKTTAQERWDISKTDTTVMKLLIELETAFLITRSMEHTRKGSKLFWHYASSARHFY